MADKQIIREHMKRFKILSLRGSNKHVIFLHVYCDMSLDKIAKAVGISRKATTRLLLGQLPTLAQLKQLQRAVLTATIELEKLTDYAKATREGVYYSQIIHHTIALGRQLSRAMTIKGTHR